MEASKYLKCPERVPIPEKTCLTAVQELQEGRPLGTGASEARMRNILDSLDLRIAVLSGEGTILAANKAWLAFDAVCVSAGHPSARVGVNYLQLLEHTATADGTFAAGGVEALKSLMSRKKRFASVDYQLEVGGAVRWYLALITPLEGSDSGAVVAHQDITQRMQSHVALEDAHKRLQVLSKRVIAIQEEERRAISLELHDDIGQSLAALKIALARIVSRKGVASEALLGECLGIADATVERIRQLSHELRPPQLDQLGLGEALAWLVERQRAATGMRIECTVAGLETRPSRDIEAACYRIAQEAINNASRHAKATSIAVSVQSDGRSLELTIRDDGQGFDEEVARAHALRSGSLGLISMEERAQYAGGRFTLRSVPDAGTTVSVRFALEAAAP